ncbi:hypothetical protein E2C01_068631 [Portunus trituberculatus]|uniref:Uncharacterized protein n=1 Tax=Portunus trituberculatus TaxID=210409 RepID=A0A5B7I0L5_PORTR|nr:hypothetical protein [Portunus trituberculatus]
MAVLERERASGVPDREEKVPRPRTGLCPVKVLPQSTNRTEELFVVIGADSLRKTCQDELLGKWIRWSLCLGHKVRKLLRRVHTMLRPPDSAATPSNPYTLGRMGGSWAFRHAESL